MVLSWNLTYDCYVFFQSCKVPNHETPCKIIRDRKTVEDLFGWYSEHLKKSPWEQHSLLLKMLLFFTSARQLMRFNQWCKWFYFVVEFWIEVKLLLSEWTQCVYGKSAMLENYAYFLYCYTPHNELASKLYYGLYHSSQLAYLHFYEIDVVAICWCCILDDTW